MTDETKGTFTLTTGVNIGDLDDGPHLIVLDFSGRQITLAVDDARRIGQQIIEAVAEVELEAALGRFYRDEMDMTPALIRELMEGIARYKKEPLVDDPTEAETEDAGPSDYLYPLPRPERLS